MYSACKLNKWGDNIQPWHTPFPILNQSVVPCMVLTVASWPEYQFLRRQVRWSAIPISLRIIYIIYVFNIYVYISITCVDLCIHHHNHNWFIEESEVMLLWNPGLFILSSAFSPFLYISFLPHKYALVHSNSSHHSLSFHVLIFSWQQGRFLLSPFY